jgi:hypothetical protein
VKAVIQQGLKYAGGNMAGKAIETEIDQDRAPSPKELLLAGGSGLVGAGLARFLDKAANASAQQAAQKALVKRLRDETLKSAKELDLVLPPSAVNPNTFTNTLDSVGGKAAVAQKAIEQNQEAINRAVREEIGLAAIDPATLQLAKAKPALVYDEVASISPKAKTTLQAYKEAENDAKMLFAEVRQQYDASKLKLAQARQKDADKLWRSIENLAAGAGKRDLPDRLNAARAEYAKLSVVERAMNPGNGDISAPELARMLDLGEKLTGKLGTIARFASAFPRFIKEASKTPQSGVNQLTTQLAALGGMGAENGPSALGRFMAMTGAPRAARSVALSPYIQRNVAQPNYGAVRQDIPAMMLRYGATNAGRQGTRED